MNRKKLFLVSLVGALILLSSSTAFAEANWYECKVLAAGGQTGAIFVQLGHPTSGADYGWYLISGDKAKEMLATTLTAVSLTRTVWCIMDMGVSTSLQAIYLKGQ